MGFNSAFKGQIIKSNLLVSLNKFFYYETMFGSKVTTVTQF